MDFRIVNIIFAVGCFIAIMFVQETQLQMLLATASIANVIPVEVRNAIEEYKKEQNK